MYNITAYLTIKNKTFYTVLTYYVDGIRKISKLSKIEEAIIEMSN